MTSISWPLSRRTPPPGTVETNAMSKKRVSAACATIKRFIETYLSEDKPKTMPWHWRCLCAWFGIAFFAVVAWFAAPRTLTDTGPTAAIIRDAIVDEALIFLLVPVSVVSLLATVIASGIDRGGPIRLFLIGATPPALAFYFATVAAEALPGPSATVT